MKITAACLSLALAFTATAHAQSMSSAPIKAGLWETTVTTTSQMQLPPELQARIDAMTPQQQATMKANMPGLGAAPPNTFTSRSCAASQTTANNLIQQAQQKMQQDGGKCTMSNQTQTATTISFDISCTMTQATATGHSTYTLVDGDHYTGTQHLTMQLSSARGSSNLVMDSTMSSHYVGADCGDVKPGSSVMVNK